MKTFIAILLIGVALTGWSLGQEKDVLVNNELNVTGSVFFRSNISLANISDFIIDNTSFYSYRIILECTNNETRVDFFSERFNVTKTMQEWCEFFDEGKIDFKENITFDWDGSIMQLNSTPFRLGTFFNDECVEVPCKCHKWGCLLYCYQCEDKEDG